jgi:hypothetical protein
MVAQPSSQPNGVKAIKSKNQLRRLKQKQRRVVAVEKPPQVA